jgi:hypothetical protein
MTDVTNTGALAPRDHNLPQNAHKMVSDRLNGEYAHIPSRARALIGAAKALDEEIASDEDEKLVTDQGTQIRDVLAGWEKQRKAEKQVYLDSGRAVDDFFGEWCKPLDAALAKLRARLSAYKQKRVDAELERRKREEQERREAAEAAAKAAAEAAAKMESDADLERAVSAEEYAKAIQEDAARAAQAAQGPVDTKVHGEYGGRSSGQRKWKCVSWDRATLDLNQLRPHLTDDAIEKAINAYIREGGRVLAGAKIDLVMTTRF